MPKVTGYNTNDILSVFRGKEISFLNKFQVSPFDGENSGNFWLGFYDATIGNGKFIFKGVEQPARTTFWVPYNELSSLTFMGSSKTALDNLWVIPWAWNSKTNSESYGSWHQFYAQTKELNVGSYARIDDVRFDKTTGDWEKQPFIKLFKEPGKSVGDWANWLFTSARKIEVADPLIAFKSFGLSDSGVVTTGQWDGSKPTYVYAHGFNDSPQGVRTDVIKNALIQKYGRTSNVVIVDWSRLSQDTSGGYPQPIFESTVTKQVGESVGAALVRAGADISNVHLIGHSLGSFVMSAAAEHIKAITGKRVNELVALDTAFGTYDTDARVSGRQDPLPFTNDIALTTRSYTISDLDFNVSIAGDTDRASTAQYAYLVQLSKTGALPFDAAWASTLAHVGINGVYADLILKGIIDYNNAFQLDTVNKFDKFGKPSLSGPFDGVIVATQPWTNNPKATLDTLTMSLQEKQSSGISQENWFKMPKVIGWTDGYQNPFIYGSHQNDVMFYDQFDGASIQTKGGVKLVGGGGDDIMLGRSIFYLSESARNTKSGTVDQFWGGEGSDIFVFGYKRYGSLEYPYKDKWDIDIFGKGLNAFSVIRDFSLSNDKLQFIWSKEQIGYKNGSDIDQGLVSDWGQGIGILANDDLVVYIPGISSLDAQRFLNDATKTSYSLYNDLDTGWLFHS